MDHSVRGYLGRRTTKELMEVLRLYLNQEDDTQDQAVITIILDILREREVDLAIERQSTGLAHLIIRIPRRQK